MNDIILHNRRILGAIAIWWTLFIFLSAFKFNPFGFLNVVGFSALLFVPGFLILIGIRLTYLELWPTLAISSAISILVTMVSMLLANSFLPLIGISDPLSSSNILSIMSLVVGSLFLYVYAYCNDRKIPFSFNWPKWLISRKDKFFSFFPLVFVLLSIMGSTVLNNGGGNGWTMLMLFGIALFAGVLALNLSRVSRDTPGMALFLIALALLLATSLRGWYITGHDVQWEYKVFELAKTHNIWSMDTYRDAYNACMSITILPTVYAQTLQLPDPYVYKILFQIIFAFTPVLTFVIARAWLSPTLAFLAALCFMAFPTFSTDMPFLARQEVAFLFYALMVYIIFEQWIPLAHRRALFLLTGIGVILSHYSTTYTIILIIGFMLVAMHTFHLLFPFLQRHSWFSESQLVKSPYRGYFSSARITWGMLGFLMAASFVWTSLITNTGDNVNKVFGETIHAVFKGFLENSRSSDAISLITFNKPSQEEEMQDYLRTMVNPLRAEHPNLYFSDSEMNQYPITLISEDTLPQTSFGIFLEEEHIPAADIISFFGKFLAKLLEVLTPIGIVYVLFRKKYGMYIDTEHYLFAIASIAFVFMNIVLPVLSTQYGVFRALQQSLFVITPFLVIGIMVLLAPIERLLQLVGIRSSSETTTNSLENSRYILPTLFVIIFFLQSSAFFASLLGGNEPPLHLANRGNYYDYYYVSRSDIAAIDWLTTLHQEYEDSPMLGSFELQADKYSQNKLGSLSTIPYSQGIIPPLVKKDTYMYLDRVTFLNHRAAIGYNGDFITYAYPLDFLNDKKDLVYSNGEVGIYK